jgi:hypothetical protein
MALQTDLRATDVSRESWVEAGGRPPGDHLRCLARFEDGAVFAYVDHGHELIRASDRELWAVERDDTLVSARSGSVLARRRGRVYFAADDDEPLYYERAI